MKLRRTLALAGLAALLAVAGLGAWRSTKDGGASIAEQVASSLRCPACDGETVAQSRSPVAAAMREVIADQLAAGRSPDQVRAWFARRYGDGVLADPPHRGIGSLLWIVPGLTLLAGVVLSARTRHRPGRPARSRAPRSAGAGCVPARRAWDLVAVGVLAMVAAVAVAGVRAGSDTASPAASPSAAPAGSDAIGQQLNLAKTLEQQGQYGAAADIYRTAAAADPDPQLQVRLAFALLRAGQPAPAAGIARQVLAGQPGNADALLVLGLAERATGSAAAADTLRRFLRLAPGHPATGEVRRLLSGPAHSRTGSGG